MTPQDVTIIRRLNTIGARAKRVALAVALRRGHKVPDSHDLLTAAEALEHGDRTVNITRRWPTLAARLRKLAKEV